MLSAAPVHRGGHLLFYVPPEEKVRLHDDPANDSGISGPPWAVAFAVFWATSPRRIRDRFGQRRTSRGHKPQLDPALSRAV